MDRRLDVKTVLAKAEHEYERLKGKHPFGIYSTGIRSRAIHALATALVHEVNKALEQPPQVASAGEVVVTAKRWKAMQAYKRQAELVVVKGSDK